MKNNKSLSERVFDKFNIFLMGFITISIVYPFIQQAVISISPPNEAAQIGLHLYTMNPTLDSYKRVLFSNNLSTAYYYTIIRTLVSTFLSVTISSMLAYTLSKKYLIGKNFWMGLVVFTMFFHGGLIPNFLLVRNLNLINSIWALILPALCSPFHIIIIRNYFKSLPDELEESARIDGANDIIIFFRIIMPLAKPIIATITLWVMVANWNAWFDAMIYITDGSIKVLQNVLREIINSTAGTQGLNQLIDSDIAGQEYTTESVKAAVLLIVIAPIVCVYPFLQRYFVKGIMVGSVKG